MTARPGINPTAYLKRDGTNTILGQITPDVTATSDGTGYQFGSTALKFNNIYSRRVMGVDIHDGGSVIFGDSYQGLYGSGGGVMSGNVVGGTSQLILGGTGAPYPPTSIIANAYAPFGTARSRCINYGGGSTMIGSAFCTTTVGFADLYIHPTAYGAFCGGYPVARGAGANLVEAQSSGSGGFIWVYTESTSGSVRATVNGAGAFVQGKIDATAGTHILEGTGDGSFTQGICRGNNQSIIRAAGDGSFAQGRTSGGGLIEAYANGSFAQGQSVTTGGYIRATGIGSFAQGRQQNLAYLIASGQGSFAQGRLRDNGTYLQATNTGSFAQGYAQNGNNITSSGVGSFAQGDSTNGAIEATAANAVQFGVGTNAVADSLQVGSDFLAKANGQHAGANDPFTLGAAATTFVATSNVMTLTGDAGTNTIATITGGIDGQLLTLIFVDGLITITDDNTHVANSVDLSAAFTGADDTVLQLIFDGTSWYEIARSVN